jgi:hypothetical protein
MTSSIPAKTAGTSLNKLLFPHELLIASSQSFMIGSCRQSCRLSILDVMDGMGWDGMGWDGMGWGEREGGFANDDEVG